MKYELNMPVKPEHFNAKGRLKMSALLYYAQEAAGAHAALLGAGWDVLQKKSLFWAVIRTRAEIFAQPTGSEIILKTWPMPTSRTAYPRCVMGYDRDGTLLFKLVSKDRQGNDITMLNAKLRILSFLGVIKRTVYIHTIFTVL